MLIRETNLIRYINSWLADGYCSITVVNYRLIRFIKFVSQISTYLWKKICKQILFNILNDNILFSIMGLKFNSSKPNGI
jgi:23S rRNA C2498 (ribose-2'-O)-methylase RlmM